MSLKPLEVPTAPRGSAGPTWSSLPSRREAPRRAANHAHASSALREGSWPRGVLSLRDSLALTREDCALAQVPVRPPSRSRGSRKHTRSHRQVRSASLSGQRARGICVRGLPVRVRSPSSRRGRYTRSHKHPVCCPARSATLATVSVIFRGVQTLEPTPRSRAPFKGSDGLDDVAVGRISASARR